MTARRTEESTTTLFTLGCLTAFGDQLVHERDPWLHVFPRMTLGALDAAFHGRDTEFVILHSQDDLIAGANSQGFAEGCGDDDASIFVDSQAGFSIPSAPRFL